MKKLLTISLFVFGIAILSSAQGVSVGLRAGMNLANATFKSSGVSVTPDAKVGFLAGAYLSVMFTEKLGLMPEAVFSTQGFKIDLGSSGSLTENFSYVNVPVLVRYNIVKYLNVHVGPQFGILMAAKGKSSGSSSVDIKDQLKTTDISAVAGAGVDLPLGLSAGLRYQLGLSNIDDSGTSGVTVKNKTFIVYVGYKLFGKK